MKTVEVEYSVATVLGQKLATPITGKTTAEIFESVDEAKTAGEWPNDKSVLDGLNSSRELAARQKAAVTATKSERERIEATDEYKREVGIKSVMAQNPKLSRERAEAVYDSILAME